MRGLLQDYALEVAGVKFAFCPDRDLYERADKNTYKRTSSAGDIFFHNYGFDICFESTEKVYGAGCSCARFGRSEAPSR